MFFGNFQRGMDKCGRILIPKKLKNDAGLKNGVIIAGCKDHIEIWAKEKWESEKLKEVIAEVL